MENLITHNNIFIQYQKIQQKNFLISTVWVEYYQPYELELFKKNGITDNWIYDNIFTYEENMQGSGTIYYAIIGEDFYNKKEFILIKSLVIINNNKYFIGYQTIVKRKPTSINIYINGKTKILLYLTDYWNKENKRTLKSLSKLIGEEIKNIHIITEKKYKTLVKPSIIFTLDEVYYYENPIIDNIPSIEKEL